MPQPSLLNGVAGTVESKPYQGPGIGEELVQMAEAFSRVKQAGQEAAMKKLQFMMDNVTKLPLDTDAIRKEAKKAGLPLASDEHIKAIADAANKAKQGGQPQGQMPSVTGSGPHGMPQLGPPQGQGQTQSPEATAAKAQQDMQKNMTHDQAFQGVFDLYASKARAIADKEFKAQGATLEAAQSAAEKNKMIDETYKLILDKNTDPEERSRAVGRMAQAAQIKLDIPTLALTTATPEQKQSMLAMARGGMTEGERYTISSNLVGTFVHEGIPAGVATKAADYLSRGLPMPADIEKQLGEMSFTQLTKQMQAMELGVKMGLGGSELKAMGQAAAHGGNIFDTLPNTFKTAFQQEMDNKNKELGIRQGEAATYAKTADTASKRLDFEDRKITLLEQNRQDKLQLTSMKLDQAAKQGKAKAEIEAFRALVMARRNGDSVSAKQIKDVIDKLPMDLEIDMNYFNALTAQSGNAATVPGSTNAVADELDGPGGPHK